MHEWLPVNGHPGRAQTCTHQQCPRCHRQKETQDHFLSCPMSQATWATKIATIELPKTSNSLQILLENLIKWAILNCRTSNQDTPPQHHRKSIQNFIEEQSKIGWNQLLKGRWSKTWVQCLDTIYPEKGEQIAIRIQIQIWKALLHAWNERCDLQHQHNNENTQATHQHLHIQVLAIYEQKQNMDAIDQQALDTPPADTLQMPPKLIREWIRRTGSFVKQGLKRAKERMKIKNHSITSFFLPMSSSDTNIQTQSKSVTAPRHLPMATTKNNKENLRPP
jgi:hypothetical protein